MSTIIQEVSFDSSQFFSGFSPQQEAILRKSYDAIGITELETKLREAIANYRQGSRRGTGYRALEAAIEDALHRHLESQGCYSQLEIEEALRVRVPSHTYIRNFSSGNNICINFMNTLAFFFNIKYIVNNFEFI